MGNYLQKHNVTDSLCIKDYFGGGKIESISTSSGYSLKDNTLNNPTNQLILDVQAWLTDANHTFDSVGAAIQSGLQASQAGTLAACFTKVTNADAATYWNVP